MLGIGALLVAIGVSAAPRVGSRVAVAGVLASSAGPVPWGLDRAGVLVVSISWGSLPSVLSSGASITAGSGTDHGQQHWRTPDRT